MSQDLPEHVRRVDLLPFIESIGEIELDDWQREMLDGLPEGTLQFSGFFDTPRSFTIAGRVFRKGHLKWLIKTKRWVPFDRKHHARPSNAPNPMLELPVRFRRIFFSEEEFDEFLRSRPYVDRSGAKRRLSKMHSSYRLRSRKRVRRG